MEGRAETAAPELASILLSSAARQRESERRFEAMVTLHQHHARRLKRRLAASDVASGDDAFIVAIADCLRQPSAALTLLGHERAVLATAASDATSRVAQNLELTLGEGPAHDIGAGPPVHGDTDVIVVRDLVHRWPLYGSAVGPLGVRAVIAAPLRLADTCVGALVAFGPTTTVAMDAVLRLQDLAAGLTHAAQALPDTFNIIESLDLMPLLDETDTHPAIHQAAGMLSVQLGTTITDAYAVLRARAFADDVDIDALAAKVVRREIRIT